MIDISEMKESQRKPKFSAGFSVGIAKQIKSEDKRRSPGKNPSKDELKLRKNPEKKRINTYSNARNEHPFYE